MGVIGIKDDMSKSSMYLGAVAWTNFVFAAIVTVLLATAGGILLGFGFSAGDTLIGMAVAAPLILLFGFLRRACYFNHRPGLALAGSVVYFVAIIVGVVLLVKTSLMAAPTAFALIGLASLLGSWQLRRSLDIALGRDKISGSIADRVRSLLAEHWTYSRWAVRTNLVYWLSSMAFIPLVGILAGASQAGALRALQNLVLPLTQIFVALEMLLVPWASGQRARTGDANTYQTMVVLTVGYVFVACLYGLALVFSGQWLVAILYGQEYYTDLAWLVPYLVIAAIVASASQGVGIVLRALRRPEIIFWASVGGAAVTITAGLYMIWLWGLLGAGLGLIINAAVVGLIIWVSVARLRQRHLRDLPSPLTIKS